MTSRKLMNKLSYGATCMNSIQSFVFICRFTPSRQELRERHDTSSVPQMFHVFIRFTLHSKPIKSIPTKTSNGGLDSFVAMGAVKKLATCWPSWILCWFRRFRCQTYQYLKHFSAVIISCNFRIYFSIANCKARIFHWKAYHCLLSQPRPLAEAGSPFAEKWISVNRKMWVAACHPFYLDPKRIFCQENFRWSGSLQNIANSMSLYLSTYCNWS